MLNNFTNVILSAALAAALGYSGYAKLKIGHLENALADEQADNIVLEINVKSCLARLDNITEDKIDDTAIDDLDLREFILPPEWLLSPQGD